MLPNNYFANQDNANELKELILNPKVSMKDIQNKYGFSRQRLYQLIAAHNLPTKYKRFRNAFKEKYGNNPTVYKLYHALIERKSHYIKQTNTKVKQDATLDDLLIEGNLPVYCPVLGIELGYSNTEGMQYNTVSIDKIDNTKGYTKGNVALISWRANKVKNDGTLEEHTKIVTYMKERLKP